MVGNIGERKKVNTVSELSLLVSLPLVKAVSFKSGEGAAQSVQPSAASKPHERDPHAVQG